MPMQECTYAFTEVPSESGTDVITYIPASLIQNFKTEAIGRI